MQALPNLADLTLCSEDFTAFDAAGQHLTRLKLCNCQVAASQDCGCVSSLFQLQLESAQMSSFHMLGLSACSHLTSLSVQGSSVYAAEIAETWSFHEADYCVPESLTKLTALSSLSFECCVKDESVEVDWLTKLTALQVLDVSVDAGSVMFPKCISTLRKLREVKIASDVEADFQIGLLFDFRQLVALEQICIQGAVTLTENFYLGDLATLPRLRSVVFSMFHNPDQRMACTLAHVAHRMGRERPDIEFAVYSNSY